MRDGFYNHAQGVIVISDRCKRGDLFGSRSGRMVVAQAHEHELRHLAGFLKFGKVLQKNFGALHVRIIEVETAVMRVGYRTQHWIADRPNLSAILRGWFSV